MTTASAQYSKYANWIADELKYVPQQIANNKSHWLFALAHGATDSAAKLDGDYEWVMRPELVTALQAMKWA